MIATVLLAIGPVIILPILGLAAVGAWLVGRKKKVHGPPGTGEIPGTGGTGGVVTAPQPFRVVQRAGTDDIRLQIDNAFATYRWAISTAAENGALPDANAEDVLRILAASLPGNGPQLTAVGLVELPDLGAVPWVDILSDAATMTWGELDEAASAWMQRKGLA